MPRPIGEVTASTYSGKRERTVTRASCYGVVRG
jgi:hypothetical protein